MTVRPFAPNGEFQNLLALPRKEMRPAHQQPKIHLNVPVLILRSTQKSGPLRDACSLTVQPKRPTLVSKETYTSAMHARSLCSRGIQSAALRFHLFRDEIVSVGQLFNHRRLCYHRHVSLDLAEAEGGPADAELFGSSGPSMIAERRFFGVPR